jgi:hypothetical protein
MGTVWKAHDEVLGRDVALKELIPSPEMSGPEREAFSARTFREARAASRVCHPGVATVYDVVEARGHPWIAMRLVPSRTLGAVVREEGPLAPRRVAEIGLQVLGALQAAHDAGVLHRDVKPDNVLLSDDGRAVLTDFGIATIEDDRSVTRTGLLIGTPAFIAPERAAGGRATRASDLWSLGVTLYIAVQGRPPFQRDNALATLAAVVHDEPPPLSRAGPLAPVILGLLDKDPATRMSAEEAWSRLTTVIAPPPPESTAPVLAVPELLTRGAPRAAPGGPARPASARPRIMLSGLVVLALAVGLLTGGMAWLTGRNLGDRTPPQVVGTPSPPDGRPSGPRPTAKAGAEQPGSQRRAGPDGTPGNSQDWGTWWRARGQHTENPWRRGGPDGKWNPPGQNAQERGKRPARENGKTATSPDMSDQGKSPKQPKKSKKAEQNGQAGESDQDGAEHVDPSRAGPSRADPPAGGGVGWVPPQAGMAPRRATGA